MKFPNLSKKQWILIAIGLLLIFTNPSIKAFKDYLGVTSYRGLRRTHNWLFFSNYEDNYGYYFGIVGNFFERPIMSFSPKKGSVVDSLQKDSLLTTTVDSASKIDSVKREDWSDYEVPPLPKGFTPLGLPIFKKFKSPEDFGKNVPYADRVYVALKDNLDITTSRSDFYKSVKDLTYVELIYEYFKNNLRGFNKTRAEFIELMQDPFQEFGGHRIDITTDAYGIPIKKKYNFTPFDKALNAH